MSDLRAHINKHLSNKEGFYDFLTRKQFYLPDVKCNIITVKFMDRVYREEIYLPKVDQVRPARIADPPSRKVIQQELIRVMSQLNPAPAGVELIRELERKEADMRWL